MKKVIILAVVMFFILFGYGVAGEVENQEAPSEEAIARVLEEANSAGRITASDFYILPDNGQCTEDDSMCVIDETIDPYGNIYQYIDVQHNGKCDMVLVWQAYYFPEKDIVYYTLFDMRECPMEM